jgi:hypothetical protein
MTPDHINGLFEFCGGLMIWASIWRLHKDKMVRGVSWLPVSFFAAWGMWNLYYYPALDQWFSFSGGVFLVASNTIWLIQLAYYNRKEQLTAS